MRIRDWVLVLLGVVLFGSRSDAQVIGVFTWQTQPFCNRVAITITQQGGLYQLTGLDDQCGAGSAPVYGTAVATATGVNLGFSVALGTGRTSHLSAVVSLATVSGTWGDGDGNVGTFAFNGGAPGRVRPGPPLLSSLPTIPSGVTVTGRAMYDSNQPSTVAGDEVMLVTLPGVAPVALTANMVKFAPATGIVGFDPECTGTMAAPTAPPGKVCIYVQTGGGFSMSTALARADALMPTRAFNISFVPTAGTGDMYFFVTWAYTAP